jgi:hypothetical protein
VALGKPLPKTAESCAAAPRQFGGAASKIAANPFSSFHTSVFFKVLMPGGFLTYLEEIVRNRFLKFFLFGLKQVNILRSECFKKILHRTIS